MKAVSQARVRRGHLMSRLLSAVAYLPGVPTSREGTKRGRSVCVPRPEHQAHSSWFRKTRPSKHQNKCKDPSHPSPPHKLPNGATCQKDSQCASGDCHKGDGPFKNVCKDHKSNGQSCSKDADCASGDCHTGHSGSDAKDRVVYGESCDHEKQHWKIIQL